MWRFDLEKEEWRWEKLLHVCTFSWFAYVDGVNVWMDGLERYPTLYIHTGINVVLITSTIDAMYEEKRERERCMYIVCMYARK